MKNFTAIQENDPRNDEKACFAILQKMEMRLRKQKISEKDVWDFYKQEYQVETRKKFTAEQWCMIRARLSAAQNHPLLFDVLVKNVMKLKEKIRQTAIEQQKAEGGQHKSPMPDPYKEVEGLYNQEFENALEEFKASLENSRF